MVCRIMAIPTVPSPGGCPERSTIEPQLPFEAGSLRLSICLYSQAVNGILTRESIYLNCVAVDLKWGAPTFF
jgi:hypothetical protein